MGTPAKKRLGGRIGVLMKKRKLRICQLAEEMNVSSPTICGWLKGDYSPSIGRLRKLAEVLEVEVDDLLRSA